MPELIRFGISLEEDLSRRFDSHIRDKGYSNRSEAIRDLIRQALIKQEWQAGGEIAGAITMIYDHHKRELLDKVTDIQHGFQPVIISSQHIHLDQHNCLEIIAIKGKVAVAQKLAGMLEAVKGIKHVTLSMSTTGKGLA